MGTSRQTSGLRPQGIALASGLSLSKYLKQPIYSVERRELKTAQYGLQDVHGAMVGKQRALALDL
eukprot:4075473-Amphidinium_carterae.1